MIKELLENQRALIIAGAISLACLAILAIVSVFDSTEILGINRWIKPMKFFVSITIFFWTTAVYLYYLKGYEKSVRFISWAMILIFTVEMIIIAGQAARGTISHFNDKTFVDEILFTIMGISIAFNTLVAFCLLYLYFCAEIDLPTAIVWGMRLGLILFLAASFEGGYMSAQIGHSVGAADGGAGFASGQLVNQKRRFARRAFFRNARFSSRAFFLIYFGKIQREIADGLDVYFCRRLFHNFHVFVRSGVAGKIAFCRILEKLI